MCQIWYLLVCNSNSICPFALTGICFWGCIDLSGIICIFCSDVNTFCSHYKIEENVWGAWGLRLYCILCRGFATTRTGKHQIYTSYIVVPAADIRDLETSLVSDPFSWFQSRQIFHETHETDKHYIFLPVFSKM